MNIHAPTLLILEDDQALRESLDFLLGSQYRITAADSADAALSYCLARAQRRETPFDALLIDLHLRSGPDGICCLQVLRSLPGYHQVPALALTGCLDAKDSPDVLAAGFSRVLTKPVLPSVLESALDELLPPTLQDMALYRQGLSIRPA